MITSNSSGWDNPIFSLEGFDYLYRLISTGPSSKELEDVLRELNIPSEYRMENSNCPKDEIKTAQLNGFIKFSLELGNFTDFLEVGCGKGRLSSRLAEKGLRGTGIDINRTLVEKNPVNSNVSFEFHDAFSYNPNKKPELVVALHGCGSLSDRAIAIAIASGSAVSYVPCCYGLMEDSPRSKTLSRKAEEFKSVVQAARALENTPSKLPRLAYLKRESIRILANFDRILRLAEAGYHIKTGSIRTASEEYATKNTHNLIISGVKSLN